MPSAHHLQITAPPLPARVRASRVSALLRLLHAVRHPRPGTRAIGPGRVTMHFLRCLPHLDTFRGWLGDPANPALREELARRPHLLTCVVHPYLNGGWQAPRRLSVIAAHYATLDGRRGLMRRPGPTLIADAGDGLRIELDQSDKFEHEGEATLHLRLGDDDLYALAFTLGEIDGQQVAYVGALQGQRSPHALELYRQLTHQWNGLRPRDLLLTAFRRFGRALGVTRILAVDDEHRVSSNAYFASSTQVRSSYDEIWRENAGLAATNGFFELSPEVPRREADAVPARKRALYRRRYAMLEALEHQIDAFVATHADLDERAVSP